MGEDEIKYDFFGCFLNPTGSNINNLKCINVIYDPEGVEYIDVRMISIKIKSLRDFGLTKMKKTA
jgi:hypothetical protein